ncbi:MAG: hypothetical protein ACI9FB_000606 [Candidatus Azotimanducaceae bacterium]|jgi:hypothetical protein
MTDKVWTRWDRVLLALAFAFPVYALGSQVMTRLDVYFAENQVFSNVQAIAGVVHTYRRSTGRWFPAADNGRSEVRVYLNPFDDVAPDYQNLNYEWLWRENNHGMVLQLVSYDEERDLWLSEYPVEHSFKQGEPYLRILLDSGVMGELESAILRRLESEFDTSLLAKLDDHLYVLDIRTLGNE